MRDDPSDTVHDAGEPPRSGGAGPAISIALLFVVGGPIALFASFLLAFASDACGLSGHGTACCSESAWPAPWERSRANLRHGSSQDS